MKRGALDFEIGLQRPSFELSVALKVAAGQQLAIIGPNGSGKSTLLQSLAGLISPDRGRIVLDGRPLFARGTKKPSIWIPPHDRNLGLLAQEPLLFPHLSVKQNIAYGPRASGSSKSEVTGRVNQLLQELKLSEFASRYPPQLSGGQQQQVALARALAVDPQVLLLDEPFAALDVRVAAKMRNLIKKQLNSSNRTCLMVSHNVLDVMTLADQVVVLDQGKIVDYNSVNQVLLQPCTPFVAAMSGLELLTGTAQAGCFLSDMGWKLYFDPHNPVRGRAYAAIPRNALQLQRGPASDIKNSAEVKILDIESTISGTRVKVSKPVGLWIEVPVDSVLDKTFEIGTTVKVQVDTTKIRVYSAG